MSANKPASPPSLGSDLAHVIQAEEYEELPELTEEMMARAKVKKGDAPEQPTHANSSPCACRPK